MCLLGVAVILLFLIESIKVIYSCFYANTFPPIGALHERNASLPSINNLVSVTVTVSLCFCSCPFPCVPEYQLWFHFLSLCQGPFSSGPAPITVPVSLFLFLSLPMPLSLFLTFPYVLVSLCSRPQAPVPSTPLCYILFYLHSRSTLERQFLSFSTASERGYNTCHICWNTCHVTPSSMLIYVSTFCKYTPISTLGKERSTLVENLNTLV